MTTTQMAATSDAALASVLMRELKAFELNEIVKQCTTEEMVIRRRNCEDRKSAKELGCTLDELNGLVSL